MLLVLGAQLASLLLEGVQFLAGYITNSSVFPQPLSDKEQQELLERMQRGDKEARNTLVERNLRLVAHIVKKFDNTGEDPDDLISIGTIGLIKGIKTFDPSKNTRLATYAARCIENEILMHLRGTKKDRGEMLLHDAIGSDQEGNEISLMDILPADEDVADEVETLVEQERLYEHLQDLTKRERSVLELRYGLRNGIKKTQREISKQLGISRSYVSRIEKKALNKLQKAMCSNT